MKVGFVESKSGHCLRSLVDGKVVDRNEASYVLCGDDVTCEGSELCRSLYKSYVECLPINSGVTVHKNIELKPNHPVDMVFIAEENSVQTIIVGRSSLEESEVVKKKFLTNYGLTKSEIKIMLEVFSGKRNQDIANMLFISKATLKTHLNNIYKKLPESLRPNHKRGKSV